MNPYNDFPYPGDTDGDRTQETFPIENLVNGQKYYAFIRTIGLGKAESEASGVVAFTPLSRGDFIISSDHTAPDGGFNFERGTQVPGRDPHSDIYLYATGTRIGLSSPDRLSAGFRHTSFNSGGKGAATEETVRISKGQTLTLKTNYGRAEIVIKEILGKYPDISIRIGYIFYPDKSGE